MLHDPVQAVAAARRPECLAGDAADGLRLPWLICARTSSPARCVVGPGAAVSGVLAVRPAPAEGEAAPGRAGAQVTA